jgi:hypothetical protein
MHGAGLSLDWTLAAARRIEPGGTILLYTGSAIVEGRDGLKEARRALEEHLPRWLLAFAMTRSTRTYSASCSTSRLMPGSSGSRDRRGHGVGRLFMQIIVRDNNVDQALRALKKKLQREGVYRERIGSANSTPRIPNSAPISSCIASTSAGARSTVRRAM